MYGCGIKNVYGTVMKQKCIALAIENLIGFFYKGLQRQWLYSQITETYVLSASAALDVTAFS